MDARQITEGRNQALMVHPQTADIAKIAHEAVRQIFVQIGKTPDSAWEDMPKGQQIAAVQEAEGHLLTLNQGQPIADLPDGAKADDIVRHQILTDVIRNIQVQFT